MRKAIALTVTTLLLLGLLATTAVAAPLPDNCERIKGTVTCTTFEGPGNNQAGVGHTVEDETKGNTTNKKPAPQELRDEDCVEQNPQNSKGKPIVCP